MVRVGRGILHFIAVARQTRRIGIVGISKPISAAGGMTVHAVQLTAFDTRTHAPACHCVVFPQIPTVRIEVSVLKRSQVEVIEVLVPGVKEAVIGLILAWHELHIAFICSVENALVLISPRLSGSAPSFLASWYAITCCLAGP